MTWGDVISTKKTGSVHQAFLNKFTSPCEKNEKNWKTCGYGKIGNTKKPVDNKRDSKIVENKANVIW